MNCTKAHQAIINTELSEDLEIHLSACPSCKELAEKVDQAMMILDDPVDIPEGLSEKIMTGIHEKKFSKYKVLNLMNFVQIAAAVAFGIFIGHKFGKNADIHSLRIEKDPIDKYIQAHHLNFWDDAFELKSIEHK